MQSRTSESIEAAAKEYPAIRTTVNLCKALNVDVRRHFVRLNHRGLVYQHCFIIQVDGKLETWPNERLKNYLRHFKKPSKHA